MKVPVVGKQNNTVYREKKRQLKNGMVNKIHTKIAAEHGKTENFSVVFEKSKCPIVVLSSSRTKSKKKHENDKVLMTTYIHIPTQTQRFDDIELT